MINQFVCVGRIVEFYEDGIEISFNKPVAEKDGHYDTEQIKIMVADNILDRLKEYCCVADLVGVNGDLATENKLVAHQVTLLSGQHFKKEEN